MYVYIYRYRYRHVCVCSCEYDSKPVKLIGYIQQSHKNLCHGQVTWDEYGWCPGHPTLNGIPQSVWVGASLLSPAFVSCEQQVAGDQAYDSRPIMRTTLEFLQTGGTKQPTKFRLCWI